MPSYTQSVLSPNPIYLQTRTYDAKSDRKPFADFLSPGIVGAGDLLVSLTSGLGISVAAGMAWVLGQNVADQGLYRQYITAAVPMTVTSNGSGNPRLDQVILRVLDSDADSGGAYEARLEIVPGTPTSGATLVNRSGAASLTTLLESSKSVLLLADILVPAGAVSFVVGNLADRRVKAGLKATFIFGADGVTTTKFLDQSGNFSTPPYPSATSGVMALTAAPVLETGIANQRRAGRPLVLTDFTTLLGLSAPVALYNLDSLTDISGNARTLTNKGAVTFGKGISGTAGEAAVFHGGTTDALYFTDTGAADPFRILYGSWGCWFKTSKRGVSQYLISKLKDTGTLYSYWLDVDASNVLVAGVYAPGQIAVTGFTDVADGRWHYGLVTYDGNTLNLYVDGHLEINKITGNGGIAVNAAPFNIGAYQAEAAVNAGLPMFGLIDEAFVTPEILSEDQVRFLYSAKVAHAATFTPNHAAANVRRLRKGRALVTGDFPSQPVRLYNFVAGVLTDSGSAGTSVTATAAPTTAPSPDGILAGSYQFFASVNQYLSSTDTGLPAGTTSKSWGCWVKTTQAATAMIMTWGTGVSANDAYISLSTTGTITALHGTGCSIISPASYNDGLWHFICVVATTGTPADGLTLKLYIDGKFVGSTTTALTSITLAGANAFRLGATASGALFFTGQISRAFIHSVALTEDEVSNLYAVGSLSLGMSPKNVGDHIERIDATNVYYIADTLESQHQLDIEVMP